MIKGIDISTWQQNVNYKKLKEEGVEFAFIRCGYGKDAGQKDKMFETHYQGLKEAGIKVGCYHYSYCNSVENAEKEAENCLSYIKGKEFDLPIFYDLEETRTSNLGKAQVTEIALRFCRRIRQAGFDAGVYANLNWFKNFIDPNLLINEGFKIWLAQWNNQITANFKIDIWQFTNSLEVAGLKVDGDYLVNENLLNKENQKPSEELSKSVEEIAIDVINGKYGNGQERKDLLGENYEVVQEKVNKILINNDIDEIVLNVIRGKYGNGQERKQRLGTLYHKIQDKVNKYYA